MYSRSMGRPSFSAGNGRAPSYHQGVRIPPNYSGIAIGASPPDGVPPATDGLMLSQIPSSATDASPLEVDIQPESETGDQSPAFVEEQSPHSEPSVKAKDTAQAKSSPLSGLFSDQHFPFGHGIGYEELLLLGLILFLLHEGEGQGENGDLSMTVLLLGALLFFG